MRNKKLVFKKLISPAPVLFTLGLSINNLWFLNGSAPGGATTAMIFANALVSWIMISKLIDLGFGGKNLTENYLRTFIGSGTLALMVVVVGCAIEYQWFLVWFFRISLVITISAFVLCLHSLLKKKQVIFIIPREDTRVWLGQQRLRKKFVEAKKLINHSKPTSRRVLIRFLWLS